MMRRRLLFGVAASSVTTPGLIGCTSAAIEDAAARSLRQPFATGGGEPASVMRELVRYATLAPSSHNTQYWKFRLAARSIMIEPDLSRRCPVVDPDDHHLHVLLGCATENLPRAALANVLRANARFDASDTSTDTGTGHITVELEATQARELLLFRAITVRQCTRSDYDGSALSAEDLSLQAPATACA